MTLFSWRQALRRLAPTVAFSLLLVAVPLLLMNHSSAAQPLSEPDVTQSAGLEIDMLGPDTTLAGQVLTFTLLITNSSGQTLPNVVVTDTLVFADL